MQTRGKIVVAMSGGVDSSVAAMLLSEAGHDVVGVSMQVWDYRNHGGNGSRATCCAPTDFNDARRVAGKLGIPYYVFDFEKSFRREVIDNFVSSYQRGLTPNPCIDCNNKVKFRELRARARSLGYGAVATGHYARISSGPQGPRLLRGADRAKDQSYFLYGIGRQELAETVFPLGDLTKDQVRAMARERGLATADKPESQDICFVSDSAQDFVRKIGGGRGAGKIVNRQGEQLGGHEGIHRFTVGQRRGLGVGGAENPLYVLEIQPESDTIVVGARDELERESFEVEECVWLSPGLEEPAQAFECIAQLRHRHAGVAVTVQPLGAGRVSVRFEASGATVSPGQAAVFYDSANDEVLGGGRICRQSNAVSSAA